MPNANESLPKVGLVAIVSTSLNQNPHLGIMGYEKQLRVQLHKNKSCVYNCSKSFCGHLPKIIHFDIMRHAMQFQTPQTYRHKSSYSLRLRSLPLRLAFRLCLHDLSYTSAPAQNIRARLTYLRSHLITLVLHILDLLLYPLAN